MSVVSLLIFFSIISPLLSLICHKSVNDTSSTNCTTDKGQFCYSIEHRKTDGTNIVEQGCSGNYGPIGCTTVVGCNDRNSCNYNGFNSNVNTSVTSRKCVCNLPNGFGNVDCTPEFECVVNASDTQTVLCMYEVGSTFLGSRQFCRIYNITGAILYNHGHINTCVCDKDMCNSVYVLPSSTVGSTTSAAAIFWYPTNTHVVVMAFMLAVVCLTS